MELLGRMKELYEEPEPAWPVAAVPYDSFYRLWKREKPGTKPEYRAGFRDILKQAGRYIRDYVRDRFGFSLEYRNLGAVKETGLSGRKFNGNRVWGMYRPDKREILVDRGLPWYLKLYVTAHELAHYAQHMMGRLGHYFRKYGKRGRLYAEREADYIALNALKKYQPCTA